MSTPGSDDGAEVLDAAVVEELRWVFGEAEPGAVDRLLEDFIVGTYERVDRLAAAAARQDLQALASVGHSLRGSSANFGAQRVVGGCWRIEQAAAEGTAGTPELAGMIDGLRREVDRAADGLRTAFGTGPTPH